MLPCVSNFPLDFLARVNSQFGCKCYDQDVNARHDPLVTSTRPPPQLSHQGPNQGGREGVFTLEVIINVKSTLVVVDRSNIKEGATGQNIFNVFLCGSFSPSLEDGLLALQVLQQSKQSKRYGHIRPIPSHVYMPP